MKLLLRGRLLRINNLLLVPLLVLAAGWFLMLRPAFLDGPASYLMVSGHSMEPTLHTGDLAVMREQGSYHPGDIVAFRIPRGEPGAGAVVIHRIAGLADDGGFVMQGDNKEHPDPWQPSAGDVVGKMWFRVPGGARFTSAASAPAFLATLAAVIVMVLVLTERRGENSRPIIIPFGEDGAAGAAGGSHGKADSA